jgi:hypothetical protein
MQGYLGMNRCVLSLVVFLFLCYSFPEADSLNTSSNASVPKYVAQVFSIAYSSDVISGNVWLEWV